MIRIEHGVNITHVFALAGALALMGMPPALYAAPAETRASQPWLPKAASCEQETETFKVLKDGSTIDAKLIQLCNLKLQASKGIASVENLGSRFAPTLEGNTVRLKTSEDWARMYFDTPVQTVSIGVFFDGKAPGEILAIAADGFTRLDSATWPTDGTAKTVTLSAPAGKTINFVVLQGPYDSSARALFDNVRATR
jgi:hypothetical protein